MTNSESSNRNVSLRSVEDILVETIRKCLSERRVHYIESVQDSRMVRQRAFKKNRSRTYAYVLFRDGVHVRRAVNFVFRLKVSENPLECLASDSDCSELAATWIDRLIRPWSSEEGTPEWAVEPARQTDQWGLMIDEADLKHTQFEATLCHFVECCVNSIGR